MNFTHDELNLMAIYDTGTRKGLIAALETMRPHLEEDEVELRGLTDSVLQKLTALSDEEYAELDLIPDFDE